MKQEDIQKALEAISTGGINVAGDFVMNKYVEYEVANVENGGIGIQINNKKEDTRLTVSDKEIKTAIDNLLKEREAEKFLFQNKKQWWAVYRVLTEYCHYPSKKTLFVSKMKEFELEDIDKKRALTYDSLAAAPKDVPFMATCSPSSWGTLKDKSDNYMQQYVVAEYLMLKLGIKS